MTKNVPLDTEEDKDLILAVMCCQDEDREAAELAFSQLYHKYTPFVLGAIKKHFPSIPEDERNDILEQVFMKVWNDAEKYDDARAEVRTWIFVITRSKCLDHLKKNKRLQDDPTDVDELDAWAYKQWKEEMADPDCDKLKENPKLIALRKELESLSERERNIICETFACWPDTDPDTTKALAQNHGTTAGNIRVIKNRVLKKVTEALNMPDN